MMGNDANLANYYTLSDKDKETLQSIIDSMKKRYVEDYLEYFIWDINMESPSASADLKVEE